MFQRGFGVAVLVFAVAVLAVAVGLEYFQQLRPCNLCIMQRLAYIACGVMGLLLVVLPRHRISRMIGGMGLVLASLAGVGLALRQVWLQHLPADQVPACGPGFQYLLSNFPFQDALLLLLSGDGDCAAVDWRFLGLSMAVWAAIGFGLLLVASVRFLFKK